MSSSQSAPATTPPFITPNTTRDLIPGMWASNMKKLEALMKEIPSESAEEEMARAWLGQYEELLGHIEQLHKFATDMSTHVPDFNGDTQNMIGSAFKVLTALQTQFLMCAAKPKSKPAVGTESGSLARAVEGVVSSGPGGSMASKDMMEVDPTPGNTEPCQCGPPTPTPTSGFPEPLASHATRKPAEKPAESSRGLSEFLSMQVESSQDEEASKVEGGKCLGSMKVEINLTETKEVTMPKGDTQSPAKGKCKTQGGHMHPIEELDKRISDIEQLVKWGKDALLDLYAQVAQSKHQLQVLKVWWQESFVEASSENP
ncbi:hypothetical protein F5141DRAFT_1061646 [Pisolithus sp. B1]|nr:hypothetical protein F5141DRAFT_1061646 [Pisolithus sp. B1]